MPDIDVIRAEIQHMRRQVQRQRGEIRQLRWAGIPSSSAETLLEKMRNKIGGRAGQPDLTPIYPEHDEPAG